MSHKDNILREFEFKSYLLTEFKTLLAMKYIDEWTSANLEFSEQRRASFILGNIREFVG